MQLLRQLERHENHSEGPEEKVKGHNKKLFECETWSNGNLFQNKKTVLNC